MHYWYIRKLVTWVTYANITCAVYQVAFYPFSVVKTFSLELDIFYFHKQ